MRNLLFFVLLFSTLLSYAQEEKAPLYHPEADAAADIAAAVSQAQEEGKHVFLQVGGNWCSWCVRFHNFCQEDASLDSLIQANYVILKVNYSKENKNEAVLAELDYPQRFGFPVFVILDGSGNRIHTQDSGLLESGKGYSSQKVERFFKNWAPSALDPSSYQGK